MRNESKTWRNSLKENPPFSKFFHDLFQAQWERLSAQLHNLSPLNILKKGYALCWRDGGQYLIRKIDEVKIEEELTVSFYKGELNCLVKKIDGAKLIESRLIKK